jgi:hypothetical protein
MRMRRIANATVGPVCDRLFSRGSQTPPYTRNVSGRAEIFFDQTNWVSGSYSRGYVSFEERKTGEKRVA